MPLVDELNFFAAFDELADDEGFFRDQLLNFMNQIFICDQYHANTHIENAIHLFRVDVAAPLDEAKQRWDGPATKSDDGAEIVGKNARNVFDEPPPVICARALTLFRVEPRGCRYERWGASNASISGRSSSGATSLKLDIPSPRPEIMTSTGRPDPSTR